MTRSPQRSARSSAWSPVRWVRDLPPVYFALVMATGIVSRGLLADGRDIASQVLLVIGIVAFVLLLVASVIRLVYYRKELIADELNPSRSFSFFTFVAGADVLAARIADDGYVAPAVGFLVVGAAAWVVLGYTLPSMLIVRHGLRPALAGADGTWFLWVVGVQSIVVAVSTLPLADKRWLAPIAVLGWSVGVVLYLAVAVLVLGRLFAFPVRPAELTPSYWVFMGATAITALAGARILQWTPSPLVTAVGPVVAGFSIVFLAFGSWLVPLLIVVSIWHERDRFPLWYEPGLWSIVFPVGMFAVACVQLGHATAVPWLVLLGSDVVYAGAGLWLAVMIAMFGSLLRRIAHPGSRTGRPAAS